VNLQSWLRCELLSVAGDAAGASGVQTCKRVPRTLVMAVSFSPRASMWVDRNAVVVTRPAHANVYLGPAPLIPTASKGLYKNMRHWRTRRAASCCRRTMASGRSTNQRLWATESVRRVGPSREVPSTAYWHHCTQPEGY